VEFAIDPYINDGSDSTQFTARISAVLLEPPASPPLDSEQTAPEQTAQVPEPSIFLGCVIALGLSAFGCRKRQHDFSE
jgi:hypothetical protein